MDEFAPARPEAPAIATFDAESQPLAPAADVFDEFNPYLPPQASGPPPPVEPPTAEGPMPHWTIIDLLLILIGGVAVFLGGGATVGILTRVANGGAPVEKITLPVILGMLTLQVVAMTLPVYLVGRFRRGYSWRDMGMRPTAWHWNLGAVGAGILCFPVMMIIALVFAKLTGEMKNPQLETLAPDGAFSWTAAIGMVLLAGVFAPWAEEVIFRGVLFRWLRNHANLYVAAAISAIVFGVAHWNLMIGVAVAPLGFAAALAYEWSGGSLWPSVIIHVVNNAPKVMLIYLMLALGLTPEKLQKMAEQAQAGRPAAEAPAVPAADADAIAEGAGREAAEAVTPGP